MATFTFTPRPRRKNGNEPLTYDITGPEPENSAGVLVKQKNRWRLRWLGVTAEFDTKRQLTLHLNLLGHRVEGLA